MIDQIWLLAPSLIPDAKLDTWRSAEPTQKPSIEGSLAIVRIAGTLQRGRSIFWWGTSTDLDSLKDTLDAIRVDKRITRVLLLVDSPGGTAAGTNAAAEAVRKLSEIKPVVAYIESIAASAAYWIASQARRIVADPTAVVGSIGTFAVLTDWTELLAKNGIKVHVIKTGEIKGMGVLGSAITKAHLDHVQEICDGLTRLFIEAAARGRKIPEGVVRGTADGRVYLAADAVAYKLIDGIGSLESALADLNRMPAPPTGDEGLAHLRHGTFEMIDTQRTKLVAEVGESNLQAWYPEFCALHREKSPKQPYIR